MRGDAVPLLDVDLDDLVMALTWHDPFGGSAHYLDRVSGEVVFVNPDVGEDLLPPGFDADDERFLRIDAIDSAESWALMGLFADQVSDPRVAQRLDRALRGPKPFRRFKDELARDPAQREAWFAFERVHMERLARRWCEDSGIKPRWVGRGAPA